MLRAWLLRSEQRGSEPRAAHEPWARPVARLLVEIVERLEDGEDLCRADRIAHCERSARIPEPEHDRTVEVLWSGNAHLDDIAAHVDDMRHDPLSDEPG